MSESISYAVVCVERQFLKSVEEIRAAWGAEGEDTDPFVADSALESLPCTERLATEDDLNALLILKRIALPDEPRLLVNAYEGNVWLGWSLADMVGKITIEDVFNLRRCGVFCDEESGDLHFLL